MKSIKISALMIAGSILMNAADAQIKYPDTKKVNQSDDYFGTKVEDPYRWLEDDNSDETKAWVVEQNTVTNAYLHAIPFRDKIKQRLEEMWNYAKYSSPFKEGGHYYFYKNDGLQNQSVLYRQVGLTGKPEVFLDPNKMSKDGTAAPGVPAFTKSAKYCAYLLAQSGSDWQEAYIMDVKSKKLLDEKIQWIKFSGISWKGDDGFYYSRYPEGDEKDKLKGKNEYHKVYYHKIGTEQSADELIYEDKEHPQMTIGAGLTEDERFLVINKSQGTSGDELWVKDMKAGGDFTLLIKGFDNEASVIDNDGDRLLVKTNIDAANYKIVSIDPKSPAKSNWKQVVPVRTKLLQNAGTAGGKLFVSYLSDASSKVYQYSLKGRMERAITLPGIGTASGFGGKAGDTDIFYSYTSFNTAPTIYHYNISTGKSDLFRRPELKINPDEYVTIQVFFKSRDSASVPMFITYKKGLKLDGNNPTLIYGYGGFNIPLTPTFSISNAFFLNQGGVYVQVSLRGGNEYGEEWHKNGMLQKKQNVFNDVFAAAQYLIGNKYTNPSKLALRGGSNGGLLVGACITQHPELFKVAIPQVGVLDMLRYHQFTIGWAWAVEYGRSDKKEDFDNLYKYSPLHNLKKGTTYPATLITTADHDDRVVPAHSFKFAAALQEANDGKNPTLIRIDSKAGHGAGKPTSKVIEEAADIWSFVMSNLGMEFK
ncbi:MAG: S9 family peptidase [Chitinophagaceae bacterium]|nr:S9 family peptidase [Chitinophagaceae bacterium]